MIGKSTDEIERENGFDWYVEFKPRHYFGFDLGEHKELMDVFIGFLPKGRIKILKLDEGNVEEVFELEYDEVLENIELLGEGKGKLYDEECEISYSILTEQFFVIIQRNMIFWSSGKELAEKWADALGEAELQVYELDFIGEGKRDSLWENKTKINGVWVDDESGEVLEK
ncbi:MAG: hypothetical protein KJ721_01935 [Nanoarchaeota archaeon]|nr:hypothetical protein [Nanoarchaeota archaeon]